MYLKKYFYFLFFAFAFKMHSQHKYESYQFIDIKESASKRPVSSVVQDPKGFIWVGTNGAGLFKYDGVNYIGYEFNSKKKGSINSNIIYTTYIDKSGQLWVGTSEGLCWYNRELDEFNNVEIRDAIVKGYKESISIKSIIQDDNSNLLLGSYGYGLLKLDLKTKNVSLVLSPIINTGNTQVNDIIKNKKGQVYLGTNHGLILLDKNYNASQVYADVLKQKPLIEPIESLMIDAEESIWVGTLLNGLIKINRNQTTDSKIFPISKNKIFSIIELDQNYILCSTENKGLFLLNKNGEIIQEYVHSKYDNHSVKSNSVWKLYKDNESRVWVGYYNKGLGVFEKLNKKFNSIESLANNENSLQTSSVTSVIKDNSGKLWISTEGGGIDIFDPVSKKIIHVNSRNQSVYQGLNADDVQSIFMDSKNNIWVGSWNHGIYFLKSGTKNFINYTASNGSGLLSNRVFSFAEDKNQRIWIGTFMSGLHYYDITKGKIFHCNSKPFTDSKLDISLIRKLLIDSDNVLWVGTISGLFQINLNNNPSWKIIALKDKMEQNFQKNNGVQTILSLHESNDKKIWIGTDGGGLFSYDKVKSAFSNYDEFPNFSEKSVSSIISSKDGSIWVSGRSGITKLDLKNKASINYTIDDGLLSNDFNNNAVYKDKNGDLFFGSYDGLNYFNPAQIVKNRNELPLYFSDFKLFNKSVPIGKKDGVLTKVISETSSITLNHNQSVFTIDYIGVNYSYLKKNEYAYYLEGLEDNWNYVGNKRSATYTNLEPGDYVFKVKSADRGGEWNNKPLELKITVLPPWWKSKLAFLLYFVTFSSLILYLNKYNQNKFKEKQARNLESERVVQIEKLNTKKLQFFTNISHEFRTPLTLIINPLEDIIDHKKEAVSAEVYEKLKVIHKSSDRLSRLINELMDFNKLQFNKMPLLVQKIEIVSFVKDVIDYFQEEVKTRSIKIDFESVAEKIEDWLDPKMFEKIIFNVVSNAIKFTPDKGEIRVTVKKNIDKMIFPLINNEDLFDSFSIAIADTGNGIDKKDLKKIFDRFYQVNNANKVYYGTTGIGLEVVKEFVELHKGIIAVESELGIGTKFTLTFPMGSSFFAQNEISIEQFKNKKNKKQEIEVNTESVLSKKTEEKEVEKIHTILIVEDNHELRNYLKNELKKIYKVIIAENGERGYELAQEKLPDLILTDVIMPRMNGIELCKKIKTDVRTSHIPLIMLSAKAMIKDKLEGIDSGADMYLSKPFDMNILKSSLSQLITSRQIMFNKFYTGLTKKAKEKTTTLDNDFIQKTLQFINENISEPELSVELLSSKVFLSRSQLYRKVKTLTGVSVNEFIRNVRLEKARILIEEGNNNINEISYKVGFTSPSYFTKCYKTKFGHLPTHVKKEEN
jgi:signal transduction histidine kinase/ligand-binding sensor domain-containing protein/DNA-binding response OmpR family regulator